VAALRTPTAAVALVAAALVLGAGALFVGLGGAHEPDPPIRACNGSAALCEQPLDRVAFAAAHNAMSAADTPGYLFADHEKGVATQLDEGVRALLIDTHYGIRTPSGRVRTDLEFPSNTERDQYIAEVGRPAFDAALRLRRRVPGLQGDGPRGIYMCHRFCELGAYPLDLGLAQIRDFVVAHPHEVVIVINQDEGVTPRDFVDAVERAGLAGHAYRGPWKRPFPTLREMIEAGHQIVFLAENRAGAASWYRPAYEVAQETPYTFTSAAELTGPERLEASCRPNRGPASADLFLVNHWVNTSPVARPSNAQRVNPRDALLRRVRQCERVRGRPANIVAVDFYRTGDVVKVVGELNRTRVSAGTAAGNT
jgi:hypothetical protein